MRAGVKVAPTPELTERALESTSLVMRPVPPLNEPVKVMLAPAAINVLLEVNEAIAGAATTDTFAVRVTFWRSALVTVSV